jgi:hypothetical protein
MVSIIESPVVEVNVADLQRLLRDLALDIGQAVQGADDQTLGNGALCLLQSAIGAPQILHEQTKSAAHRTGLSAARHRLAEDDTNGCQMDLESLL